MRLGGARGLHFPAPGGQPREPHRSQGERQGHGLAKQFGGQVERGNIAQHPLPQGHALEVRHVLPQSDLGIGSAIHVFKEEMRQAAARQFAEVRNVGGLHVGLLWIERVYLRPTDWRACRRVISRCYT